MSDKAPKDTDLAAGASKLKKVRLGALARRPPHARTQTTTVDKSKPIVKGEADAQAEKVVAGGKK